MLCCDTLLAEEITLVVYDLYYVSVSRVEEVQMFMHFFFFRFFLQGLRWYAKRLQVDEDGDVADEFLDEVLPLTLLTQEVKGNCHILK